MGTNRAVLERQLAAARAGLASWADQLGSRGVAETDYRRDPKWRALDAECRAVATRIHAVAAVEAREAEALQRKAAASGGDA
jgi:hypothetical protein